jgi:HSP20 family molecular chaperone IbpA
MSLFQSLVPSFGRSPAYGGDAKNPEFGHAVRPVFEVRETDEAYGLTVHLPGVAKEGLEITAESGVLRVAGRKGWKQPEGWTALYVESADAPYELVLEHDNAIDADKIHAELRDGVLRVSLPKSEAVKPRKISVT